MRLNRLDQISKIIPLLKAFGVRKAGVFGSFARGEDDKTSDIDILIDFPEDVSLLKILNLQNEISAMLDRPIDLVEYQHLKPYIKNRALKEEIRII